MYNTFFCTCDSPGYRISVGDWTWALKMDARTDSKPDGKIDFKIESKLKKYYKHTISKWLERTRTKHCFNAENGNKPSDAEHFVNSTPNLFSTHNHYPDQLNQAFDESMHSNSTDRISPNENQCHNNQSHQNQPNIKNDQNHSTNHQNYHNQSKRGSYPPTNYRYKKPLSSINDNHSSNSMTTVSTGSSSGSTHCSTNNSSNQPTNPQHSRNHKISTNKSKTTTSISPEILLVFKSPDKNNPGSSRKIDGYYLNLEATRAQQEKIFINNQRVPNPNYEKYENNRRIHNQATITTGQQQHNGIGQRISQRTSHVPINKFERRVPVFESSSAPININYGRINTVNLEEYYARGDNRWTHKLETREKDELELNAGLKFVSCVKNSWSSIKKSVAADFEPRSVNIIRKYMNVIKKYDWSENVLTIQFP